MSRRFCPAFVAVVVAGLALAAPAAAQIQHQRKPPVARPPAAPPPSQTDLHYRVDGFAPSSGRAGTRVTIRGDGFTRTTSVLVGGRSARVLSWNRTEIAFAMPDLPGDVEIVLRRPRAGGDLRVGLFHLIGDTMVRRLSPAYGPPGTRVEILGRGFQRAAIVTMNGLSLPVGEWTPERMVVAIPEGATTDFILVSNPGGEKIRSPLRFRVLSRSPVVARVAPEVGPPGTRVRISGSSFTPADRVAYGSMPTQVLGRGPGWVDVEVPRRTARSDYFEVRGPGGVGRSPRPFTLDVPPVIARFSPSRGAPGTQVDIWGKNFRDGDWVSLAGKRLPIIHLGPRRIGATIPIGSASGRLAIGRENRETATAGLFEVLNPPALTAFTPTRGEPGTRVTLTGSHLTGAAVYYGKERIPVRQLQGDSALVVEIPRAARDERFRVRTSAGSAESQRVFQVQYYAVIEDASPRAGVPGATVVLRGRHMDKADDFYIGSTRFELIARDNNSATCKVPEGARTAPIAWMSFGKREVTPWRFEVLTGPVISQFQPTYGPAGTEIIIRGDHIDRRTRASFGRTPLRVVRVSPPHEITVQLPRSAAGTDYLYLEGYGARIRSEQSFEVKVAPLVTAVEPSSARPGQKVTVRGRWLTAATEILIGKVRCRVIRRDRRGESMVIEIPRDVPPGSHVLSAKSEALVSELGRPFVVLPSASIDGISPVRARWGERVRVDGVALGRGVRIWFRSVELPIVRRSPDGRQAWVVIPDTARGSAYLEVEDDGPRRRSPAELTIDEPRTDRVEVRDHRKPGSQK